jgi:hypothetical protein
MPVPLGENNHSGHNGRFYIELVNGRFLKEGGTPDQFRAGTAQAICVRLALAARIRDLCEIHRRRRRAFCLKRLRTQGRLPVRCDFVETGPESPGHTRWARAVWPNPNRAFVMSCASSPAIDDTSTVGCAMATGAASVCGIGRAED